LIGNNCQQLFFVTKLVAHIFPKRGILSLCLFYGWNGLKITMKSSSPRPISCTYSFFVPPASAMARK
jgi:hypothetical protein